jgi:hypothetical protein
MVEGQIVSFQRKFEGLVLFADPREEGRIRMNAYRVLLPTGKRKKSTYKLLGSSMTIPDHWWTKNPGAKKPAAAERKPPIERPHKNLTQTQEEVANLASDILLNGGEREDVNLLLTALLRHRVRRRSLSSDGTGQSGAKRQLVGQLPCGKVLPGPREALARKEAQIG